MKRIPSFCSDTAEPIKVNRIFYEHGRIVTAIRNEKILSHSTIEVVEEFIGILHRRCKDSFSKLLISTLADFCSIRHTLPIVIIQEPAEEKLDIVANLKVIINNLQADISRLVAVNI